MSINKLVEDSTVSGENSESQMVNINNSTSVSNITITNTNLQIPLQEDPDQCTTRKQHHLDRLSPSNSPHKLGKVGPKRPRTIPIKNLCKSLHEAVSTPLAVLSVVLSQLKTLNKENSEEKNEQDALKTKLQSYIVQKCICDYYPETITNHRLNNWPSMTTQ